MTWRLIGPLRNVERIAVGASLRERARLRRTYGPGRWRKVKGIGTIELWNGMIIDAELHWYEAHRIGRREMKIKRFLEAP